MATRVDLGWRKKTQIPKLGQWMRQSESGKRLDCEQQNPPRIVRKPACQETQTTNWQPGKATLRWFPVGLPAKRKHTHTHTSKTETSNTESNIPFSVGEEKGGHGLRVLPCAGCIKIETMPDELQALSMGKSCEACINKNNLEKKHPYLTWCLMLQKVRHPY